MTRNHISCKRKLFVAEQNIFKYVQHNTARIVTEKFYCKCIHFKVRKEPLLMHWYNKHRKLITNRAPCYMSVIQFPIKSANYGNKNVNMWPIFNFLSLRELQSNVSLYTYTHIHTLSNIITQNADDQAVLYGWIVTYYQLNILPL